MPTIAIVGAGPGLGLAIARRFGREGFRVALVSRAESKLDALAARLAEDGIQAAGLPATSLTGRRCGRRSPRPGSGSAASTCSSTRPPRAAR